MAKLLSPVSTTDSLLKFQTLSSSFCSNNQWRILAKTTTSRSSNLWPTTITTGGGRIKAVAEESSSFDGVADDYYTVLGLVAPGMGTSADVFRMASSRWEKRQSKVLETARLRMMKQKGSNKPGSNWRDLWGSAKDYENTGTLPPK